MGLGRVLDQREVVAVGEGGELVDGGRVPVEVDGDHRRGARGDGGADGFGVQAETARVDVGEDAGRAGEADRGGGGGGEGEGGDDDLVAGADGQGQEGEPQGGGAGVDRDAVASVDQGRELFFEGGDFGALDEPAGAQDAQGRRDVRVIDPRRGLLRIRVVWSAVRWRS